MNKRVYYKANHFMTILSKTIFLLYTSLLSLSVFFVSFHAEDINEFGGGNGSVDNPYLISTISHLEAINNHLEEALYYKLVNDIDMKDSIDENLFQETDFLNPFTNNVNGFVPIGYENSSFSGYFDGNNHKITGIWIKRAGYVGLFSTLDKATIKNLTIIMDEKGMANPSELSVGMFSGVGGIAGSLNSTSLIENCYVKGVVSGNDNIGGIAGSISDDSKIITSFADVTINTYGTCAGGITGKMENSIIRDSLAIGNINCLILPEQEPGTISHYWTGGITGSFYDGEIARSLFLGKINNPGEFYGGIAGEIDIDTSVIVTSFYNKTLNSSFRAIGNNTSLYEELGKTATELKQKDTYQGLDLTNIWLFTKDGKILLRNYAPIKPNATYQLDDTTYSITVNDDYSLVKPNPLVKEGYNFKGWFTSLDYSLEWNFATDYTYEDIVLYPYFEIIPNNDDFPIAAIIGIVIGAITLISILILLLVKKKKRKLISSRQNNHENYVLSSILTKRELETAILILEGKSRKEIADILFITETTAKKHTENILKKTNCKNQKDFIIKYQDKA